MSQSRAHSLFESVANTAIGFALSMRAVVSIARTYAIRRAFNARLRRFAP